MLKFTNLVAAFFAMSAINVNGNSQEIENPASGK